MERRHLDAPDFLEYLAQDTETDIIAIYVEGVKDGPGIYVCCPEMPGKKKPVVILGAGQPKTAPAPPFRIRFSHMVTRELEGFFNRPAQFPPLTTDETADIIQALTRIRKMSGQRVAIVGREEASEWWQRISVNVPD